MSTVVTCDYLVDGEPCGGVAIERPAEGNLSGIAYRMDVCERHEKDLQRDLQNLGFFPSSMSVGRKRRAVHVTKSGRAFSSATARKWLIANGYIEAGSKGRLGQEQLDLYAEHH